MKFLTVIPERRSMQVIDVEDHHAALRSIGIDPMRTDHGTLTRELAVVVYEFGLMEPQWQHFFGFNRALYVGNAIIYQFGRDGETCDIEPDNVELFDEHITFFNSREEAETAIIAGMIDRPQTAITTFNKDTGDAETAVMWEWRA